LPIGLLELAGEARWRDDIVGAPDPGTAERPLSPCVISTVSQRPEAMAAAAWRTWIMNEQPPTAVPSTHFGVSPR
jgi:hypothetical protein